METKGFFYVVSHSFEMVFARACGHLKLQDFHNTIAECGSDPQIRSDYRVVVDISKSTYTPSIADVRDIVSTIANFHKTFDRSIAVVVANSVSFQLTKLTGAYASINTNLTVAPFYSLDEAFAWIKSCDDEALPAST